MRTFRLLTALLCLVWCGNVFAQTQEMDKELTALAQKLGTKIKASGKKKITVLDFTDLDGGATDLGKYVAEQLTVDFVSEDLGFTVVDRANLKKILAEHKLTASGLIDPENAKKLGKISGVDALILGTLVSMTPNIKLTAKIISAESAEIVAGGQCTFKSDENIQRLLTRATPASEVTNPGNKESPDQPAHKPIGDLKIVVESVKYLNADYPELVTMRLTLQITNTSMTQSQAIAIPQSLNDIHLSDALGNSWRVRQANGIKAAHLNDLGQLYGDLTDIPPHASIMVVINSDGPKSASNAQPFRLEALLIWGTVTNGKLSYLKEHNFIMDFK